MDKVIEQLKSLRDIRPDRDRMATRRALLLSQISGQQTRQKDSIFVNAWFLLKSLLPTSLCKFAVRPLGIISAVVLVVLGSGVFGVSASRDSLPGDFLYSVKLTGERVKVSLSSQKEQAGLHAEFARERVKEIERVVANNKNSDEEKKAKVLVAVNGIQSEMKLAQEKLDSSQKDLKPTVVVEVAKKVDAQTIEINNLLKENKENLKDNEDILKNLAKAQVSVEATGVKAIEVIVSKHTKGMVSMTETELVKKIEEKINNAKENVKDVESVIKANKEESETVANVDEGLPVIKVEEDKDSLDSSGEVKEPVEVVLTKPVEAEQKIIEAKELLNNGDLASAVQKVMETAVLTTQAVAEIETKESAIVPVEIQVGQ